MKISEGVEKITRSDVIQLYNEMRVKIVLGSCPENVLPDFLNAPPEVLHSALKNLFQRIPLEVVQHSITELLKSLEDPESSYRQHLAILDPDRSVESYVEAFTYLDEHLVEIVEDAEGVPLVLDIDALKREYLPH
jgi:hypothetical protein